MGIDNQKIHEAFDEVCDTMVETASAEEAVQAAFHLAKVMWFY